MGVHPGDDDEAREEDLCDVYPFAVPRKHITRRFNKTQGAAVKRIYEPTYVEWPVDPPCCWGCTYRFAEGLWEDDILQGDHSRQFYPNVWLCRLIVLNGDVRDADLLDQLADLSAADFWEKWHLRFVTCDDPPVRRVQGKRGSDEWEPEPDPGLDED